MHRFAPIAVTVIAALVACKSDKAKDAPAPATAPVTPVTPAPPPATGPTKGFDRACTAATDCVVVKAATCDPCGCPSDAIASKAMAQFDEAQAKLDCKVDLDAKCKPCATMVAECRAATCVAVPKS